MSSGKFVLGALVGGAIGAVVGLLVAPRSGVETREMISEELSTKYDDAKDRLSDAAANAKDRVSEIAADLEETGKKAVDSVTAKLPGSGGNNKPAKA